MNIQNNNQQLTQLSKVIDCLRVEVSQTLPIQHVALLLAVVETPGVSMQNLVVQLNMTQASVSRNIKILVEQYGFLQTKNLEVNLRQYAVYPTEKCIEFVEKLCGLLMPETDECSGLM